MKDVIDKLIMQQATSNKQQATSNKQIRLLNIHIEI